MKTKGVDNFSKRLDEIFEQGMITKAQIIDAYNKFASQPKQDFLQVEQPFLPDIYLEKLTHGLISEEYFLEHWVIQTEFDDKASKTHERMKKRLAWVSQQLANIEQPDKNESELSALQSSKEEENSRTGRGNCPDCDGFGYTAEHDPTHPHEGGDCEGYCPIQVQCQRCEGTGWITNQQKEIRDESNIYTLGI